MKNRTIGKHVPMRMVFCPTAGEMRWSNPTRKGAYRCTKCGQEHVVVSDNKTA